ncbi:TerD family protein [Chryseobacterium wanjuense]
MAINLQKGQTINLRKNELGNSVYDLSTVTIGLGWDVRRQGGFWGSLLGINDDAMIMIWTPLLFF